MVEIHRVAETMAFHDISIRRCFGQSDNECTRYRQGEKSRLCCFVKRGHKVTTMHDHHTHRTSASYTTKLSVTLVVPYVLDKTAICHAPAMLPPIVFLD